MSSKVITAHSTSVDGYITGRDPAPGNGLGDGGALFDWYFDGDMPSEVFTSFRLSAPSARVFDAAASRVGAVVAGRTTYDDSSGFGGDSPHPTAPLFVVSQRPAPAEAGAQQTFVSSLEDAIAAAKAVAGDKDVSVMGGSLATSALAAGLIDEVIVHQIPVLLGAGRPFFQELPAHVRLRLVEAVPAPGVTHLHYEVER